MKSRSSHAPTRAYIPASSQSLPTQPPSLSPQPQEAANFQRPASSSNSNLSAYGLLPPNRINPFSNIPQNSASQTAPSARARYSPAPAVQSNVPSSQIRYAASPATGSRPSPPVDLPFQPRTSSPLARSKIVKLNSQTADHSRKIPADADMPSDEAPRGQSTAYTTAIISSPQYPQRLDGSKHYANQRSSNHTEAAPDKPHPGQVAASLSLMNRYEQANSTSAPTYTQDAPMTGPLVSNEPSDVFGSGYTAPVSTEIERPRRSQTQSPGAMVSRPFPPTSVKDIYQRPASVNDKALPRQPNAGTMTAPFNNRRPRGFSQHLEYIRPIDGREHDPLERWKGCPLFNFGFGGTIVTTFPRTVQRVATGHNAPLLKCSPGEVMIQSRQMYPFEMNLISFPGPLKSKGRKKDVLEWLQHRLVQMEQAHGDIVPDSVLPDPRKRHEEKIILWRIAKVLVEFDGVIEGKSAAQTAIRLILSPELVEGLANDLPPSSNAHLLGISRAGVSQTIPDSTEVGDIETLRRILLQGEREKAVWHALDRRLWAHAMLISSTLDKNVWKQVLQEFIRQEVKTIGDNSDSLAALYQIFAGNWEESVDELVPPSARAGLQFISKAAGSGPTRNALDGLDRWRETLALTLSNRTHEDGQALIALGRLLLGYGRVEAAHICFVFAKAPGTFGGEDDPLASVALLGADHNRYPNDFSRDVDAILLTEIYEFASTVLATSSTPTLLPHLQAYKLYHAMLLAENGSRNEAQEYCNVVTSAMKSTTKLSPYYHNALWASLDDLVNRLRQAPNVGSSSWMSKPSLDKVSGSFLSRFNQFIAGDESDADSAASGKGTDPAAGPFAGVTGDTPNISRAPSSSDLYSSYPSQPPLGTTTAQTSRYAPGGQYAPQGQYTPRTSFEQNHGHFQDNRLQKETLRPQPLNVSRPNSSGSLYQQPPQLSARSSYQPLSQTPSYPSQQGGYPTPPVMPDSAASIPIQEPSPSLHRQEKYHATPPPEHQPLYDSHQPHPASQPDTRQEIESVYQQPTALPEDPVVSTYKPSSSTYEPALNAPSSYEPPTYSPYIPDDDQDDNKSIEHEKPKNRKSMGDDDDDFEARAAATLKQQKAQRDREADEAFRKAAEADSTSLFPSNNILPLIIIIAQKGNDLKPKKSGWLGGWFSGTKKEGDLSAQNAPNVIKAKLGEESSFVYDKELKKWINKKAGSEAPTAAASTPPPPRGPPSRAVSASAAPPMRKGTDTPPVPPLPATATPPVSVIAPPGAVPTPSPFGSNAASRSASPSLLQREQSGLETGPPAAPPSRPATGMSNANSIDDLIGAPQARKGGTIKKGKKGRGYVDVMASK